MPNVPQLDFSRERMARVRQTADRWWAGQLERPMVNVTLTGYDEGRPAPALPYHHFTAFYDLAVPAEAVVERVYRQLCTQRFVGDAFPGWWPNFGPGVVAAFLGCELLSRMDHPTVWFHPRRQQELGDIQLQLDPENVWFRRIGDIMAAAVARFDGCVQVGMTDLGGNLDIVSSFRPGELLPLDLLEDGEAVERVTWQAHDRWWQAFDAYNRILRPANPGYTGWAPIFSSEPYYILQCDFCYMIGPKMFDRFVKPELAATCRRLTNPFYHLDGKGQLPHLDSLLTIPELKGVQWVPGDGQPWIMDWPEVYRKIHAAGKLIQIWCENSATPLRPLDVIADQIGTAKGFVVLGGVGREHEDDLRRDLRRYGIDA